MVTMDVKIEGDVLKRLQTSFERAPSITAEQLLKAIDRATIGYRDTARNLAPHNTSALANSIEHVPARQDSSVFTGEVRTNSPYARYQEEGTGLYGPYKRSIRPRNKPYMVFKIDGKWIRTKKVKGTKPKRYMLGSFEQRQAETMHYLTAALDSVVDILRGGKGGS